MKIDPRSTIAGFPILAVRDALKKLRNQEWTIAWLADALGIEPTQVTGLFEELGREGYIEVSSTWSDAEHWHLSTRGYALTMVKAIKRTERKKAERILEEFLGRVIELRDSPHFLYKVQRAFLFGSMLNPEAETVGDIDLAVSLSSREKDSERHMELEQEYIRRALDQGRHFGNYVDQLAAPRYDVIRFLKARSRVLSIHDADYEPILRITESKLIYEDPDGISR